MGNYIAFKNYTKNFKLFHKFHKKLIFINCKNLCHLRNSISTWNESPKWSLILYYYSWWGLCWFLPSFVKTLSIRVCMSSGSNRGLCDTVVDLQCTKFLKVSIRLGFRPLISIILTSKLHHCDTSLFVLLFVRDISALLETPSMLKWLEETQLPCWQTSSRHCGS